jgi:hypothetical protein
MWSVIFISDGKLQKNDEPNIGDYA